MSTDDPQWASEKRRVIEKRLTEVKGRKAQLASDQHATALTPRDRRYRTLKSIGKEIEELERQEDKLERQREALLREEKRRQKQAQPGGKSAENVTPTPGNVLAGKKPEDVREKQPEHAQQSFTIPRSATPSSARRLAAIIKEASKQSARDQYLDGEIERKAMKRKLHAQLSDAIKDTEYWLTLKLTTKERGHVKQMLTVLLPWRQAANELLSGSPFSDAARDWREYPRMFLYLYGKASKARGSAVGEHLGPLADGLSSTFAEANKTAVETWLAARKAHKKPKHKPKPKPPATRSRRETIKLKLEEIERVTGRMLKRWEFARAAGYSVRNLQLFQQGKCTRDVETAFNRLLKDPAKTIVENLDKKTRH